MKRLTFLFLLLVVLSGKAHARGRNTTDISAVIGRSATYTDALNKAAARYSVDPRLLWTIAYLESRFRPGLVSPKGARGMMQFMPATGRRYGLLTRRDLHNPILSIEAAAKYVRDLNGLLGGRIDLILAGYNAGENAVINSGYRVPRYYETRRYVARGLAILRRLDLGDFTIANREELNSSTFNIKNTAYKSRQGSLPQQDLPRFHPARSIYFPK